jgi:transcriptional regulator with XRE-family HTH domain
MPGDPGPMVRRRQLSMLLHRYRLNSGKSVKEAAEQLFEAPSKITRIEKGQRLASVRDIVDLCRIYGLSDEIQEQLMELARGSRDRQWWQRTDLSPALQVLAGMEGSAQTIRQLEIALVPGLLQTPAYADAVLRTWISDAGKRDGMVAIRMKRQEILQPDDRPLLRIVLDEAAVRRVVGGSVLMREQLEHLAEQATAGACDLRIIPFSAGAHPGSRNSFTVLEFGTLTALPDETTIPGVVFLESSDGEKYLDSSDVVDYHVSLFERLHSQALSSEESIALLRITAASL